jgi:hydroxycarboxylate dehydrogenase B
MLAILIDVSRLGEPAAIEADVEAIKAHIRSSSVAPGFNEVLLPGEPERRAAAEREASGILVDATTWGDIQEAAGKLGITDTEIDQAIGANQRATG